MPSPSAAEEHLRVIRTLMEKATTYRAISANAALVAGTAACLMGLSYPTALIQSESATIFIARWFGVLAISAAANFYFLYRDAQKRGEPFISAGMKMALRAMTVPLLCGALVSVWAPVRAVPSFWMIFYGLALLTTQHFAPKSLRRLGQAFAILGLGLLFASERLAADFLRINDWMMAGSFGLLHLIYAVCAWPRRQPAALSAALL